MESSSQESRCSMIPNNIRRKQKTHRCTYHVQKYDIFVDIIIWIILDFCLYDEEDGMNRSLLKLMEKHITVGENILRRMTSNDGPHPPSKRRVRKWTPQLDTALMRILLDHYVRGNWKGSSFTNRSWKEIVQQFDAQTKLQYDKGKLLTRWKHLKELYREYHSLFTRSGWRMDPTTSWPIAPSEATWFELPERLRRLRGVPFPHYHDINTIVGKDTATREHATSQMDMQVDVEELVPATQGSIPLPEECYNLCTSTSGQKRKANSTSVSRSVENIEHLLQELVSIRKEPISRVDLQREVTSAAIGGCMAIVKERVPNIDGPTNLKLVTYFANSRNRSIFDHVCDTEENFRAWYLDFLSQ